MLSVDLRAVGGSTCCQWIYMLSPSFGISKRNFTGLITVEFKINQSINQSIHTYIAPCVASESEARSG